MMIASVCGSLLNRSRQLDEVQALDRVAADADAGGLADAAGAALPDGFVGERAASG